MGPLPQPVRQPRNCPGNRPCLGRYDVVGVLVPRLGARRRDDESGRRVPLESFFFPLDGIADWNRLYGRRGFLQYQLALPRDASAKGLEAVLDRVSSAGKGSFLAVLKLFGPGNESPLSFPLEGATLALDFRVEPSLFPLLDELDRIVLDHGGRLYLAKDARMPASVFRSGYPRWVELTELRRRLGCKGRLESLQSRRLGL